MSELCSLPMWASGRKCCPDCSHPDDVECSGCGFVGDPLLTAFASRIRWQERRRLRNPTPAMLEAAARASYDAEGKRARVLGVDRAPWDVLPAWVRANLTQDIRPGIAAVADALEAGEGERRG